MSAIKKNPKHIEDAELAEKAIGMLQNAIDRIRERGVKDCYIEYEYPTRIRPFSISCLLKSPSIEPTGEEVLTFTITLPPRKETP